LGFLRKRNKPCLTVSKTHDTIHTHERKKMKNWICHNLFGENPESVDAFGMTFGLSLLSLLVGSWIVLFVVCPFIG
jgi:hypothetical protein